MAKKRNRHKASQKQSGRNSQTTMGTILVAIVGLAYWWFTGNSPDALINNNDISSGTIVATSTVQSVAQTSDEADTPAEVVAESNADAASVELAEDEAGEDESPAADTPAPDPPAKDTPASDPKATATTPPKPTNTDIPRPRGPPGLPEIHIDDLPPEARDTIDLIFSGGPYPFDRDGITFQNREGILPDHNRGYYEEYTVITPGLSHRGARRIVIGRENEMYYTDDHYESFSWIAED